MNSDCRPISRYTVQRVRQASGLQPGRTCDHTGPHADAEELEALDRELRPSRISFEDLPDGGFIDRGYLEAPDFPPDLGMLCWYSTVDYPTLAQVWWSAVGYDPNEDRLMSEFLGIRPTVDGRAVWGASGPALVVGQWFESFLDADPVLPSSAAPRPERCQVMPAVGDLHEILVDPVWMKPDSDGWFHPCDPRDPDASSWWERRTRFFRSKSTLRRYARLYRVRLSHRRFAEVLQRVPADRLVDELRGRSTCNP